MNPCAYCHRTAPATKEHIWPNSLIDRFEHGLKTFNHRSSRFYSGDPVVKDVCGDCNSGRLNRLDTYLCEVFDRFMHRVLLPGEGVQLEYDYDLLLRALLKITYNSSRVMTEAKTTETLARFSSFILNGGYHPHVVLRLQIVTASKAVNFVTEESHDFGPHALRTGTMAYEGPLQHRFFVRLIGINSYWFFLVFSFKEERLIKWREFGELWSQWAVPSGVPLKRDVGKVAIPKEKTTYFTPAMLGALRQALS